MTRQRRSRPIEVIAVFLATLVASLLVLEVLPRIDIDTRRASTPASGLTGAAFRVIHGDTAQLGPERIRIENIDTPETGPRVACQHERDLARRATHAARQAFRSAGQVRVIRTGIDRYGRTLARIRLDGRDFGQFMIADGLAVRWNGRQHEWCR